MVDLKALYGGLWQEGGGRLRETGRVIALAARGFLQDQCVLRASTLTFYSLLSIVPLLATVFGIAKGFGLHRILEKALTSEVEWQRELTAFLIKFSSAALENARGGLIAGIGVIAFFFAVVGMLGAIEGSFNTIWKVREQRGFGRQFADYLSVVLIGTVLLSVSAGVNVFLTAQVQAVAQKVAFLPHASGAVLSLLHLVPFFIDWLLFAFLYAFMPNTRVPLYSAVWAGIAAGTVFQLAQWVYIRFQVGVSSYGAVYGSFAALPLFLVWLQMNWTITLVGCEISYAIVNRRTYGFPPEYGAAGPYVRMTLGAAVMREAVRAFAQGREPPTARELCSLLRIPGMYFFPVAGVLIRAGLLREACRGAGPPGYLPGVPPGRLTLASVYDAFERAGPVDIPDGAAQGVERAAGEVERVETAAREAARTVRLSEEG